MGPQPKMVWFQPKTMSTRDIWPGINQNGSSWKKLKGAFALFSKVLGDGGDKERWNGMGGVGVDVQGN